MEGILRDNPDFRPSFVRSVLPQCLLVIAGMPVRLLVAKRKPVVPYVRLPKYENY